MFSPENNLDASIQAIYEGATNDGAWLAALKKIEHLTRSNNIHLLISNRNTHDLVFGITSRFEDSNMEYISHYANIDERLPRIMNLPNGGVASNLTLLTDEERKSSAVYNEYLQKYEAQSQSICRLNGPGDTDIILALIRSNTAGEFDANENTYFSLLMPHIIQAINIRHQMVAAKIHGEPLQALMEQQSSATIFLDQSKNIIEANSKAVNILEMNDGLSINKKQLLAARQSENVQLQSILHGSTLAGRGFTSAQPGGVIAISRPSMKRNYNCIVTPVKMEMLDFGARRPTSMAVIIDPEKAISTPTAHLQILYKFTASEAKLSALLCNTLSLKEAADQMGIAEGTARQYLKSIFSKTRVHTQAQLIACLLKL